MTLMKTLALTLTVALSAANAAGAATLNAQTAGITSPETFLTFSEVAIPNGSQVTTQYAGYGVTFTPYLIDNSQGGNFPNISGDRLGNWSPLVNPFSIKFSSATTDASFAMVTNFGTSTFTALLNGVVVESFSSVTAAFLNNNFYGFTGSLFDEIRVNAGGSGNFMLMDNLAFTSAPPPAAVPVPASGILLLSALGLAAFMRRRRTTV